MGVTGIEWTDRTWNPTVGCTKISAGCARCYAKTLHDQRHKAHREGKAVPAQYAQPFEVLQLMPDRLPDPLSWRKPCRVFVNSVSDLFHDDVPDEFLLKVFAVMAAAGKHTFQVLTKRAARMADFVGRLGRSYAHLEAAAREIGYTFQFRHEGRTIPTLPWPIPNVWLGVSAENQAEADERIPHLLATPAAVRFLSCEPLLGPVHIRGFGTQFDDTPRTDSGFWVIVGGESGPDARPMNLEWARSLVAQCKAANVACFVKQMGARPYHQTPDMHGPQDLFLRDKKGGDPVEWPEDLRVREFPSVA